ncbi:MAG TPA: hypothetical protein V6C76_00615 [Drouetiella sp.]
MKDEDKLRCTELLSTLELELIKRIPNAIESSKLTEQVYCMQIVYFGSDSEGDRVPYLQLPKVSARDEFINEHGEKAPHYIWCPDEVEAPEQSFDIQLEDAPLRALCARLYNILDRYSVAPLRQMLVKLSRNLNELDWTHTSVVTEDFVVYPADYSHEIGYHELMRDSIPTQRLDLLRNKKMLLED